MHRDAADRLDLLADLQTAIDEGQLRVVYQPIVALEDERVVGVEALVRWAHPERGMIPPDSFIPFAEETGLVMGLGRFVLHEACRQMFRLNRLTGANLSVSVNVSARQLETDVLVDDVMNALAASGLSPRHLVLELTETALMSDPCAVAERLTRLKEVGIRIAVDDFGTGYSSLNYLQQFPLDILKIDRSFIANMTETREATALVHTLVQLGKSLNLATLAEGVELDEQALALADESCELAQGYLFSYPLTPDALLAFIKRPLSPISRSTSITS